MSVVSAYERLVATIGGSVRKAEPLARHTTYRIGGPAALFAECDSVSDLSAALSIADEEGLGWTMLGKGSNVLVSDEGYEGLVIVLGREFERFTVDGARLLCGGGVVLGVVVQEAFRRGLTGLEFAVGVPGTVGGAVAMNAGSRDVWIGEAVETLTLYSPERGLHSIRGDEVRWGYRRAGIPKGSVIVEATLRLHEGDVGAIRRVMEASLRRRKRTQPIGWPSAGSTFKNPEGDSAGRLIEAAGLKGLAIGGAAVSEVHANFIVNTGGATAADVVAVMNVVRDTVRDAYGIELEPEVRFLGSFEHA